MKKVTILGSTGSIGENTLKVLSNFKDRFSVYAITANSDFAGLAYQINKYSPKKCAIADERKESSLKKLLRKKTNISAGAEAVNQIAQSPEVDIVVLGISGSAALVPLLSAIKKSKTILVANKEALVMAGEIIIREAKKYKARLIPVDSEESAIWQCLEANSGKQINKIYLTASGGPLYDIPENDFRNISVQRVLKHPRWNMGKKITVDSATLMNKGFEAIETKWLFGVELSDIEILIHRQAVIHSMVEFVDGVIMAQLSVPDMKIPIQYALGYPERLKCPSSFIDFRKTLNLTFEKPDFNRFPCLGLAIWALKKAGTMPAVLAASDEEAVGAFLDKKISFKDIPVVISRVLEKHKNHNASCIGEVLNADNWARQKTREIIGGQ